eukprot:Gregarina_sp_Poly_1__5381@NODE_283_length_10075_cov_114_472622_g245_i0_p9_GENE_NODE_283_length_10075_cov_114_472622_g245_i0NODE_283_length_10075_cov_114_472622_g245_i0_p9_ORF_typecomplete_len141_score6_83RVP_2/PF08284_11/2_4e07gagasp_proteas/PF13975_6/2_7e07Asp_protease/PF09668_10/3_3e07Asp_protease_2/PF13650_6/7_3e07RVP/PF00077_20/1e06Peptidase_A2B/PF12384_8/3_7e06DUF1758/PF05585_12/0_00076Peptidase_A3/PF02160_15/0_095_NODE_283_length_10075_cov_114_472622_g245_i092079629
MSRTGMKSSSRIYKMMAPIQIENHTLLALVDSGATHSAINTTLLKKLHMPLQKTPIKQGKTSGRKQNISIIGTVTSSYLLIWGTNASWETGISETWFWTFGARRSRGHLAQFHYKKQTKFSSVKRLLRQQCQTSMMNRLS